jgi:hypothetical protein
VLLLASGFSLRIAFKEVQFEFWRDEKMARFQIG